MSALTLHTRYQLLEQVRVPMAMVGNIAFPALSFLFFIVPQASLRDDPAAATSAACSTSKGRTRRRGSSR